MIERLRASVASASGRIQTTAGLLAQLDVWGALADLAHHEGYARPTVDDGFVIDLEGCRHPVVERMMPRETFIPNDVRLDESGRVIVLTGPNMAGKSTLLRQMGSRPNGGWRVRPEAGRGSGVVTGCSRVGAADNLGRGQSTFVEI